MEVLAHQRPRPILLSLLIKASWEAEARATVTAPLDRTSAGDPGRNVGARGAPLARGTLGRSIWRPRPRTPNPRWEHWRACWCVAGGPPVRALN